MNDPHVAFLKYRVMPTDEVSYRDPERVEFESAHFEGVLEEGTLVLHPRDHFPSVSEARVPADRFVRGWELHARFEAGHDSIRFEYVTAEVIDRNPSPRDGSHTISVQAGELLVVGEEISLHITKIVYPAPPPDYFEFTPDVEILWNRLQSYRDGREPLPAMAYFCLSWLENMAGGRREAASKLHVDRAVLQKVGELSSRRGDQRSARKATRGQSFTPLREQDRRWLVAAVESLIQRLAELQRPKLSRIGMDDLPPL